MAKQSKDKWESEHLRNMARYARRIDEIFLAAVGETSRIAANTPNFDPDKPFSFDAYTNTKIRIDKLISELKSKVQMVILNGIDAEWTLANNKNNELANVVFGKNAKRLTDEQSRRYYRKNDEARRAFAERTVSGLNLSDRVWKYTDQFKSEIEMGIDVGLRDGLSADQMSRQLRQYLQQPDKLFRRVRDEHGVLHLSKQAKAYHPGQGVYRSSYKNARRLAATETNIAYRTSDYLRWQQFDFVVGIEIKLSNNHTIKNSKGEPVPFEDICDTLAGKYPKDFKFTGWHPQCRCYAVSIMKTDEEIAEDTRKILNGEPLDGNSANRVDDVPQAFKDWVSNNSERIEAARQRGTLPYFIKDNESIIYAPQNKSADVPKLLPDKQTFNPIQLSKLRDEYLVHFFDDESSYENGIASEFDYMSIKNKVKQALKKVDIKLEHSEVTILGDDSFVLQYQANDEDVFALTRTFTKTGDVFEVHHDYFKLAEKAQGKGTSKQILSMFYEQYKRMGVTEITLDANLNIGGYTWARYGFSAVDKNTALNAVKKAEARTFIEDYYKKNGLSEDKPFPMILLTEQTWGKEALLGSFWAGRLDLKDPAQVALFEKYLGLR